MQVFFYLLPLVGGSETKLLGARVYPGPVEDLQLNASHVAVLIAGAALHAGAFVAQTPLFGFSHAMTRYIVGTSDLQVG